MALAMAAGAYGDVREELHKLLLADAGKAARTGSAPARAQPERVGTTRSTLSTLELPAPVVAPHEDSLGRFFRTGILLSDHPDNPAKKISVGPCEGGQLLNLKSAW